ncbi:MAG: tripartite tricarboxylate transporter substrate binding protein [Burkholderiales bacterium]
MRTQPRRSFIANAVASGMAVVALLAGGQVQAQQWPSRTIRLVVPFPPGGSVDNMARQLAPKLQAALGQTVIIDNRSGAGGTVGAAEVARAAPDGHTLLMVFDSYATYPLVFPKLSFDVRKDLVPVTQIASNPMVLVVHPSVPATDVKTFVELLKSAPDRYNFASIGPASSNHLSGELFKAVTGTSITHVPYRGGGPAQQDLLGGQVELMFLSAPLALPHVKGGKLRALAQTGLERAAAFANLPTMAESGYPALEAESWNGLMVPAGTPRAVIDRLQAEIHRIVTEPAFAERLKEQGQTPIANTPEQFAARIAGDLAKWTALVKERGLSLE